MLKIKNGKLIASNMAFALPEDFKLNLNMPGGKYHILEFESERGIIKNGRIFINIEFEEAELTAKEAMEEFIENCELKLKGEFKPITRSKGTALAAHIQGTEGFSDHYEERYDFASNSLNQNQVTVSIYLLPDKQKKLEDSVLDVLNLPNIKAFLESIEYF